MFEFKIVTWNINSVRLRIERVTDFLKAEQPDVLCLQETKCHEAEFPTAAFASAGYSYVHIKGQKGMHGVATVARHEIEQLDTPDFCREEHARVVSSRVSGVRIDNIYLPAGGDEADPEINPKFDHKLDFVARMEKAYAALPEGDDTIVVGDLNIAPHEADVWSHKQLLKVVSHTPIETDGLKRVIAAGRFTDIARAAVPDKQKLFTWWSYRSRDWAKSNRGRRLDHIWANPAASPKVDMDSYQIHLAQRGGFKPSDHAPVSVVLNL